MVTVMNISFEYYRVFYYVALCGNITQAAALLYVNQPNLTRTIHLLEQALGCPLFLRSNRGVTLTPEGELLFSHVAPAVEHIESAQRELTAQAEMRQGSVSIAASEVAREAFGEEVVDHYLNRAGVELAAFEAAVTDWERYRTFERL